MSKKNLPHIQLYIGDWERDCNVLSLEAEMAWMKIVFKMHLSGKEPVYKTSAKGLQILWKCSPQKVQEIIAELDINQICGIQSLADGYEFKSRRLEKENTTSKTRSEAAKKRYIKDQKDTNPTSKTPAKVLQNTDIDNDNDIDIDNKNVNNGKEGMGEKPTVLLPYTSAEFATQWQLWKNYRHKEHRQNYHSPESEQAALAELNSLAQGQQTTAIAILHQSMGKGWKGLFELKPQGNAGKPPAGKSKVKYSDDFKRKIAQRLQSG
ncbi:hypothetical protein [Flavobacterium alkalisoli]|uniref:hypothetical protein n=1 Tax=Flavobacterium alkalisoli TaxID=2602769 RepID=UPI003A8C97F0